MTIFPSLWQLILRSAKQDVWAREVKSGGLGDQFLHRFDLDPRRWCELLDPRDLGRRQAGEQIFQIIERVDAVSSQNRSGNPHFKARSVRPVENLRESLHCEYYSSLRSATPLRFPTGLTTPPKLAGDCGKLSLPRKIPGRVRGNFPQTPGRIKTTALPGAHSQVVCLRLFFTPAVTPAFAPQGR